MLAGYDQKSNVVLSDSKERVYSLDEGVEEVPLGLYLVKGDMMCVASRLFSALSPPPTPDVRPPVVIAMCPGHVLIIHSFLFPASSSARSTRNVTARSTILPFALIPSHRFDTKSRSHPVSPPSRPFLATSPLPPP